jgi:putative heme-binding domain-containing protein
MLRDRIAVTLTLCLLCILQVPRQLDAADAAAGRAIFIRKSCVACHAVGQGRRTLGPDLSKLEKKLTRADLLEAMMDPDKKIRKGYESFVVLTDAGKVYSGRIVEKTDDAITLITTNEKGVQEIVIKQDDIDVMKQSTTSLMPRGLLKGLADSDIEDLLAYLNSLPDTKPFPANVLTRVAKAGGATVNRRVKFEPMASVASRTVFPQVDAEIELTTVPMQMRYDNTVFQVRPGSRVRLTLRNSDEMHHNLVVCKPGKLTWLDVAKAAWALGPDGPKMGFVPDSDLVVAATRQVPLGQQDTIDFAVPDVEGSYPFVCTLPGHAFLMRGEIIVSNSRHAIEDIHYSYYEGDWQKLPDFDAIKAKRSGRVESKLISIKNRDRDDRFAFLFEAKLQTAVDGEYTFFVTSDDGSHITINGKTVVDNDGVHGEGEPVSGKVQLTKGSHKLRIAMFELSGGEALHAAWSGPGLKVQPITEGTPASRFQQVQQFALEVGDTARVVRVNMPDATSRAIAVGLPGEMNYCFDAQTCEVKYAWTGAFLDVGPDRGFGRGRGGAVCKVLGKRFNVGANGFPLRFGNSDTPPEVRFMGYRRNPAGPVFTYRAGSAIIRQSVSAAVTATGLIYTFRIDDSVQQAVRFQLKPDGLKLSSSAGTWDGGTLTVPAAESKSFTVNVELPQ